MVRESARAGRIVFFEESARDDADHLRAIDAPHAATTMLRIAPDGALTHIRNGAQDRAHGTDPALYLKHLHAAGNQARSAASTADLPSATWNE